MVLQDLAGAAPRSILIVVENLPVPFDRRVWNEATTLVRAGHRVTVICPKGKGYEAAEELLDGVHILRHPLPLEANGALGYALEYGSALLMEFWLACKAFRRHRFDVIHACNPPDTIFLLGVLFKLLFGVRFVFDHHDLNPELYEAKFGRRGFFWRLMVLLERLTYQTADLAISPNLSYRQVALERGGMAEDRVFVVRSGPNLARMKVQPADPSLKNGRAFMVGYLGVMGKQEGLTYLLQAARHLVLDHGRTDILFRLCGAGPELPALQAEATALGLQDHVIFEGRIPDDRLLAVLNSCDVLVNPDEVNAMNDKSTMNKIMEYMAVAKPVVQFDMTEGRFSAQDAALYAKPNDFADLAAKIADLLADPDRRAAMGAFGRQRVEQVLAWDHEAPKLLAAYAALPAPANRPWWRWRAAR